jgi:hypothetical protein
MKSKKSILKGKKFEIKQMSDLKGGFYKRPVLGITKTYSDVATSPLPADTSGGTFEISID